MPGSIAINQDEEPQNEVSKSADVIDKDSDEIKNLQPPDTTQVINVWNDFIASIQNDYPELKSLLMLLNPIINDNMELVLEVKNMLQKDKIEEHKAKLIPFMRDKLQNHFISLKVNVNSEKVESAKPVTPAEKLQFMVEKNAHILDLQKKFGLEPEY